MRIGTPGYMSPEQIEGGEIDRRSDIFAVGAVFYEFLAYREAFTGTNTRQIENKVLESHPVPLSSIVPDLDPEIQAIISTALAKNPRDRYQDAAIDGRGPRAPALEDGSGRCRSGGAADARAARLGLGPAGIARRRRLPPLAAGLQGWRH